MKKSDLIQQVATRSGVAPEAAADQMDQVVNRLLRALRSGQPARLPGLGTITPGRRWTFRQERDER